jgi:hypothetical protein
VTGAILYDPNDIRKIQYRTVKPSDFSALLRRIRRLTKAIEENWEQFSDEDKDALKHLAYDLIEPPKGFLRVWISIWARIYTFILVQRNQFELFVSCAEALDILIDSILNAIERENNLYKQVFFDTLEEVKKSSSGEYRDSE